MARAETSVEATPQQITEQAICDGLAKIVGFAVHREKIPIGDGLALEFGAVNPEKNFYGETWSRLGKIQPAHFEKIAAEMLKLQLLEKRLGRPCRKALCFGDLLWGKFFAGRSWLAEAAKSFGIQIVVVKIPEETLLQVFAAQRRQRLGRAT